MAACPHIALVGFSGAGKSTVARLAAPRLGRPCLDTDAAIEQACGMKIPQIFSTRGEDYFRARETEALRRALDSHPPAIIACGGGVVTSPENFALLEEHALVVYLKVSPERALA
ncbi:MAG: shikimate kinase, partial [Actinomycetia bacterium]|nr:shikimate kinase [Actinomycetes bacterium]